MATPFEYVHVVFVFSEMRPLPKHFVFFYYLYLSKLHIKLIR